MARLFWAILLLHTIQLSWAGPLPDPSLTSYLSNVVPACAQPCLQEFIAQNYPIQVCTAENFNCLCINPTRSGYTIGEGALTCLIASCSSHDPELSSKVYTICSGIPGAQSNDHSVLNPALESLTGITQAMSSATATSVPSTPPRSTPSSLSQTSNNIQMSSSTDSFKSSTSRPSMSTSSTSTIMPTFTPTTPSGTASSGTAAAIAAASAKSSVSSQPANTMLSRPQIAGVIVAVIGAAALAFGLCFLLVCIRKRSSGRRESDASFIGDKISRSEDSTPDMAALAARDFAYDDDTQDAVDVPNRMPNKLRKSIRKSGADWQQWNKQADTDAIGLALGPELLEHSYGERPLPQTDRGYRTASQLLPEAPLYGDTIPAPLRPHRQASHSHQSFILQDGTVYAPENSPPMTGPRFPSALDTSHALLQAQLGPRSMSDPFYANSSATSPNSYRGIPFTIPNTAATTPSISRPRASYSPFPSAKMAQPTSPNSQQFVLPRSSSIRPAQARQSHRSSVDRRPSGKHSSGRRSNTSSQYTRFSTGSETSFEDADDELPPPPVSHHTSASHKYSLSPVKEARTPPRLAIESSMHAKDADKPDSESPTRMINRPRPAYRF